jgi:hypothetical protein
MPNRAVRTSRFQSDRFFRVEANNRSSSGWYYEAREGTCGPFPSRAMAERSLRLLIETNPRRRGHESDRVASPLVALPAI